MSLVLAKKWSSDFPLLYDFAPSAERVRLLDSNMRSELAESLRYVLTELEPHVPIPEAERSIFFQRLAEGPVSPLLFAAYSDLILSIDEDNLEAAGRLVEFLLAQPKYQPGLEIRELGHPAEDRASSLYVHSIDTDPTVPLALRPPPTKATEASRKKIAAALALLDQADPTLAAEIRALLREIILCAGSGELDHYTFDGGSSMFLWGAVLINATRPGNELTMVQMLAHESAHNLLFGLCPDEPLLENDPEERYPSPLREDLRPLEGIYHATFVCARMHRAMHQLAESGLLSPTQQIEVGKLVENNAKAFLEGIQVIDQHARLTPPGKAILDGARAYLAPFLKS